MAEDDVVHSAATKGKMPIMVFFRDARYIQYVMLLLISVFKIYDIKGKSVLLC